MEQETEVEKRDYLMWTVCGLPVCTDWSQVPLDHMISTCISVRTLLHVEAYPELK